MSSGDGGSHLQTGRFAPYRQFVRLRRSYATKQTRNSDAQTPSHLRKKLKRIVVTREVDTRSEHNPVTPPRKFLGGVRLNGHSPRRRSGSMDVPSLPPLLPNTATVDGSRFFEDDRWRTSCLVTNLASVPDTAPVGAFENDTGAKERAVPCEATTTQILSACDGFEPTFTAENLGKKTPATSRELQHESGDSTPEDQRRFSCAPSQFQSTRPVRSASLLKGVALNVRLGRRMRARLRISEPVELDAAHSQGPGRVAMPRQITIERRLRTQQKVENLRGSGGIQENPTAHHNTLRLVDSCVEESRPNSVAHDLELAFLHSPTGIKRSSNGLTESMKLLQEQAVNGQLPGDTRFSLDDFGAPKSNFPAPYATSTKDPDAPPIIRVTEPGAENPKFNPPNPGPRTSSKGGIFASFIKAGTGKVPPPVASPLVSGGHAPNTAKHRKGSTSSFNGDFGNSMNPAVSTDTLVMIEAQVSPTRPTHIDITSVRPRFTTMQSIDSGPSGSPPERALPQLPEDDSTEGARSVCSTRKRHSRKQSKSSLTHTKDKPSISSISTVRGISPVTIVGPTRTSQEQAWKSHPDALQSVAYRQALESMPVDHSTVGITGDLRSPTSTYNQEGSSNVTGAFMETQAQKVARPDRVKALKQRDITSQASIEEEDERDMASPTKRTFDRLDQFPNVPNSRPASRASTRRARSTQRAQSAARRVPHGGANQKLTASGIMILADARPSTPKLKTNRPVSTKSQTAGSPLRESSIASLRHKPKHNLLKKGSQRSTRSHISTSAIAMNGAHTSPSSSGSSEAENELPVADMQRLQLRMIEKLTADMTMLGREIVRLKKMQTLMLPATNRSRSRDLSQERQFAPSSFHFNPRRAFGSISSTAASDAGPGTAVAGDDSADEDAEGGRRLSEAVPTAKMDSMVDHLQMAQMVGVTAVWQDAPAVRIEKVEDQQQKTGMGRKKRAGRILWS